MKHIVTHRNESNDTWKVFPRVICLLHMGKSHVSYTHGTRMHESQMTHGKSFHLSYDSFLCVTMCHIHMEHVCTSKVTHIKKSYATQMKQSPLAPPFSAAPVCISREPFVCVSLCIEDVMCDTYERDIFGTALVYLSRTFCVSHTKVDCFMCFANDYLLCVTHNYLSHDSAFVYWVATVSRID